MNYEKLKSFYQQADASVTLINAAVADKDEVRPFFL